ncbi:hypothetical protein PoB_001471100 [Plakobranchus ocellatus]|uniref:UspA domain-containing protein n=1 Tax=Plakobranchus ocellatus TaxID=259542 RepID=A0AAV3YLR6_9GAST|nr:hypothetical protein PoB_001471100 [Plakobranchus ocellatus]
MDLSGNTRRVAVCVDHKRQSWDTLIWYINHVYEPNDDITIVYCPDIQLYHLTFSSMIYDYQNHVNASGDLKHQVLGTVRSLEQILINNKVTGRVQVLTGFFPTRAILKYIKTRSPHLVIVPGFDQNILEDVTNSSCCLTSFLRSKIGPEKWAGYLSRKSPVPVLASSCRHLWDSRQEVSTSFSDSSRVSHVKIEQTVTGGKRASANA